MKYFKSELWQKMQDSSTRDFAEEKWKFNTELYMKYFNEIRGALPKKFVAIYEKEHGFHDFNITEIVYKLCERKTTRNTFNLVIELSMDNKMYSIEFKKVEMININILQNFYCICGKMSWGYSEFEILENGKIKLAILCDVLNEIELVFDNIQIRRKQKIGQA